MSQTHPRLWAYRGGTFRGLREISADEIEAYEEAVEHLHEFIGAEDLLQICRNNERDFGATLAELRTLAGQDDPSVAEGKFLALEMNRRLLSVLTSLRLYAEYNETRFKRRFGTDSKEVAGLKTVFANAYDSSFSYRFLCGLRNYAQHCGLPIEYVRTTSRLREDETLEHKLEVNFEMKKLLAKGRKCWGSRGRADLERAPLLMDVEPVVSEVIPVLEQIQNGLQAVERTSLLSSGRAALRVVGEAYLQGAEPVLGVAGVGIPPDEFRSLAVPIELLDRIGLRHTTVRRASE
ncbi:hypothetical protein [Candidatus Palauibacter sp.]|uniref:hypothetical protein n=1 Tax=Candidatus Palauibacter sp. TaxID=3101350 RepID=UPI003B5B341F